jgi:hypothetical protein
VTTEKVLVNDADITYKIMFLKKELQGLGRLNLKIIRGITLIFVPLNFFPPVLYGITPDLSHFRD